MWPTPWQIRCQPLPATGSEQGPADARDRTEVCRRRVSLNGRDRQSFTDEIDVLEL